MPSWRTAADVAVTSALLIWIFHGSASVVDEMFGNVAKLFANVWATDAPLSLRFGVSILLCSLTGFLGTVAFFTYEYLNPWIHEMFEGRSFFKLRNHSLDLNPRMRKLFEAKAARRRGMLLLFFLVPIAVSYAGLSRVPSSPFLFNTVTTAVAGLRDCSAQRLRQTSTSAWFRVHTDATSALWDEHPAVEMTFLYADGHVMSELLHSANETVMMPLYGSAISSTRCGVAFTFTAGSKRPVYIAPWIPYILPMSPTSPELPPVPRSFGEERE